MKVVVDAGLVHGQEHEHDAASPCTPDGGTYTVRGHLTGPAGASGQGKPRGVTLYLHGLGLGEWLWNFQPVQALQLRAPAWRAPGTSR